MTLSLEDTLLAVRREVDVKLAEDHVSEEMAFTDYMLEQMVEAGSIDEYTLSYSERSDFKLNAYGTSAEGSVVHLVVTAYSGTAETVDLPTKGLRAYALKGQAYYDFVRDGKASLMTEGTDERETADFLAGAISACTKIRIVVISDMNLPTAILRDSNGFRGGKEITVDLKGLSHMRDLLNSNGIPEEIDIDLREVVGHPLQCLRMPNSDPDGGEVYTTILPGSFLATLYDHYSQRILEGNVRSFLKATTGTNKGIRKTLRETPEKFMAYNNGIVITATEATVSQRHGTLQIERLRGLQIVNGGQTTASLYMADAKDKVDLSNCYVQAKVVVMSPGMTHEHIRPISEYANTQNAVKASDLSSNDPYHRAVQMLSRSVQRDGRKWYYERANGQYSVDLQMARNRGVARLRAFETEFPKECKFNKLDLATAVSIWENTPAKVSEGRQAIYETWRKRLGDEAHLLEADDYKCLVAQVIIMKDARKVISREAFSGHRVQIGNYTLGLIAHACEGNFDFERVWRSQGISPEMKNLVAELSHEVNYAIRAIAGDAHIDSVCKKERTWTLIKDYGIEVSLEGLPEVESLDFQNEGLQIPPMMV